MGLNEIIFEVSLHSKEVQILCSEARAETRWLGLTQLRQDQFRWMRKVWSKRVEKWHGRINKQWVWTVHKRGQKDGRGRDGHISQSVQSLSHVQLFVTPWTAAARLPCPSPTPGAYSNSCSSSQWCHPTISCSVIPFSSCLQSFPVSGSFTMILFSTSGGQSIGVPASASVLPMWQYFEEKDFL